MNDSEASGPPFRAEVIGSLLRPRALKDAAQALQAGELSKDEYEQVLEREIGRVIARQEDLGFRAVTDGELARSSWFGFFFEGMDGFRLAPARFQFKDAEGRAFEWPTCVAEAPIRRRAPIALAEFLRARRHARTALVKATLPAPSAFHFFRLGGAVEGKAYSDVEGYFDDLAAVYRAEIADLAHAGCRYLQLDEVPLAMLCDPDVRRQAGGEGADPEALVDTYIALIKRILEPRPTGMTVGMHLCRGNFRGRWMAAGGYEPVAEKLLIETPVDAFLLEYDTDRAGNFEPLRFLPRSKRAILGLYSSKAGVLEEEAVVVRRIEEAARLVPLNQLGVSTQCGFASVAGGNTLGESEQWAKLERVAQCARRVWGST